MITTVNLNTLELSEFTGIENPRQHAKATFPLFARHGTQRSATVYFEIDPGDNLGRHTDSAEEILLILDGEIEAEVGEEKGMLTKGSLVLVPEMIPHDFKNVGSEKAKVLGFFGGSNNIVATFEQAWLPARSSVVDTSKIPA